MHESHAIGSKIGKEGAVIGGGGIGNALACDASMLFLMELYWVAVELVMQ